MKKNTIRFEALFRVLLIAAIAGFGRTAAAQAEPARSGRPKLLSECDDIPGLRKPFTFETEQMDVGKFITMLADSRVGGDLNVVISSRVQGTVKLMLKGVTIGDAMEIALAGNNLAYEIKRTGPRSIINIMTDEEYRALHGVGFYEQRQVKIVELKFAKPSRVSAMLEGVRSQIGKIIYDDVSGTLVLIDTPAKIAEMGDVIAKSDLETIERQIPTVTRVIRLQYADLADVHREVLTKLTKEVGSVTINAKTKTLVVTDLEHAVAAVEKMVAAFDQKPKQVEILAKILEIELADQNSMGINWKHVLEGVNPRFSLMTDVPMSGNSGPQITYKTIAGGGDLTVVLDALKTVGNTKIISNPHIFAMDGEEANIKVIRNQPWKKVAFESGTTNVVGVDYEFIEIGTTLSVTPVINDDGFITVKIKPTISELDAWYDAAPGSEGIVGIPVVKKVEAETSVTVKDGVTIIIGGMIKTEKTQDRVGVPVLGSIPILGGLFRSNVERTSKSETLVFLTPRIRSGDAPYVEMSDDDKEMKLRVNGKAEEKGD